MVKTYYIVYYLSNFHINDDIRLIIDSLTALDIRPLIRQTNIFTSKTNSNPINI